jgi:hypothetical protein
MIRRLGDLPLICGYISGKRCMNRATHFLCDAKGEIKLDNVVPRCEYHVSGWKYLLSNHWIELSPEEIMAMEIHES